MQWLQKNGSPDYYKLPQKVHRFYIELEGEPEHWFGFMQKRTVERQGVVTELTLVENGVTLKCDQQEIPNIVYDLITNRIAAIFQIVRLTDVD